MVNRASRRMPARGHNARMHDAGFLLISLRPVGGHAGLRRAATRMGGQVMAMSPLRIVERSDAHTRVQLRDAMQCGCVVFTSPAAVRAASRLQTLKPERMQAILGVGESTRRALQRAGIAQAQAPARMDSEGVLAMPQITSLQRGDAVGLVTAPGGRGEITQQLQARGMNVVRADVYARAQARIADAAWQRLLRALDDAASPVFLALSSGEAFDAFLAQAPSLIEQALHSVTVIAASQRLATLARERGFKHIVIAASARPQDLLAAIPRD